MENDRVKWVVIVGIFLLALSGGYLIYQAFKPKTPAWQPKQEIQPPKVQTPSPTPGISGVSTPSAATLPRTGSPIGLMAIFASSALISGFFLRKFPQ